MVAKWLFEKKAGLKVKLLGGETRMPVRGSEGAAGWDVSSAYNL